MELKGYEYTFKIKINLNKIDRIVWIYKIKNSEDKYYFPSFFV